MILGVNDENQIANKEQNGFFQDSMTIMTQKQKIQLFEDKKVRTAWDDQEEKWYFSIVDVCAVLSESEKTLRPIGVSLRTV